MRPPILYSCQTLLSLRINRVYFGDRHFVWCTPHFDAEAARSRGAAAPPTALPAEIYHSLWEEVEAGDRHGAKIASQKTGIVKGASERMRQGVITPDQHREIAFAVEHAETRDFDPLLYVIPFTRVRRRLRMVRVAERAHPLSEEFVLDDMRGGEFDVIRLRRSR